MVTGLPCSESAQCQPNGAHSGCGAHSVNPMVAGVTWGNVSLGQCSMQPQAGGGGGRQVSLAAAGASLCLGAEVALSSAG